MSNFSAPTRHPSTGKIENAMWMDDYFGRHRYGVRFPNGEVLNPEVWPDLKPIRPPVVEAEVCDMVSQKKEDQ